MVGFMGLFQGVFRHSRPVDCHHSGDYRDSSVSQVGDSSGESEASEFLKRLYGGDGFALFQERED